MFALMLFMKFVLPFYDLVVCTMLFFLPISTCKVCTNKFYDIYAISKSLVTRSTSMFSFVTKGVITLLVTKEKIEVELTATEILIL